MLLFFCVCVLFTFFSFFFFAELVFSLNDTVREGKNDKTGGMHILYIYYLIIKISFINL